MLEDVIFGKLTMPGEIIRILVAFLGTAAATYYDVYNNKNVPDKFLFGFLAVAFLLNVFFYEETLFSFSIAVAVFFSAIGYLFYRVGQLGGADVIILAAIMLLLPIHPSFSGLPFNLPFVFSVIIFSGVLFALYVIGYFGWKLRETDAKPKLMYALMLIPYLLFAYVYVTSFLFSMVYFAFVSVLLLATIFFLMYKESMNKMLSEELPVSQLEPEDVVALELMNKDLVRMHKIPRLLTAKEIERLQKENVPDIRVFTKLPPFLPFILVGMVLSMLFGSSLLLL